MYPIAASFRSQLSRSLISVSSTSVSSITAKSFPKHASMSFFATGSSSLTGTSTSAGEPQRRPFWATTPVDEPKINDATVAASKAAPVDAVEPEKEKKPKKARAKKEPKAPKKAKETADSDESIVLPETDKDIWGTDYISRVVAAKNDIAIRKSKKIVDDIFETIADGLLQKKQVRIARFGSFVTHVSKERTMTNMHTKESYSVPAKLRAKFTISSTLRAKVTELEVPAGGDTK